LIILGDGPQREVLETYTQEVGLTDRVIFTGLVPFEEIPAYLKAADIFCFASTTETQGLVTMEALAAGLPVIAVDATGTRDAVVSGQEGLLTDNDPAALAQAIQQILADDALLTHLQTNALKKAGNFEMTIQAKKMVAVYEQAIDDKKANRYVQIDRDRVEAAMHERQENA
jgi:glycosyltransferase involved in cell wall biosynthesis